MPNPTIIRRVVSIRGGSGAPTLDPDVVAWAAQVVTNGGGAPTIATKLAFSTAVTGLKSDGVWSKIVAINLGAPDSLIAFRTPILKGNGNVLWANTNFVSGDLSVNGLTGNGSDKRLDSQINCGTVFTSSQSCGFAWYAQNSTGVGVDAGIDTVSSLFTFASHFSDGNSIGQNGGAGNDLRTATHGAGYYCDSRVSSTDHRLFFANSTNAHAQIGSTNATSFTGSLGNVASCKLFCTDSSGPVLFTSDTLSMFVWHQGFTAVESAQVFSRLDTLRGIIGGRV